MRLNLSRRTPSAPKARPRRARAAWASHRQRSWSWPLVRSSPPSHAAVLPRRCSERLPRVPPLEHGRTRPARCTPCSDAHFVTRKTACGCPAPRAPAPNNPFRLLGPRATRGFSTKVHRSQKCKLARQRELARQVLLTYIHLKSDIKTLK
jgi:hypothetical protein